MQEMRARVYGRVQMVMYRDFTKRAARRLKLCGTVKNLPDGTVHVVAQGDRAALEALLARMHTGSLLSRVDRIEVEWTETNSPMSTFTIAY